ncbi:DUF3108 domain-containing protein [Lewinella cohaerens]|uniref:DUF3108 domain-containing protein n=1 Tax=Lewinella cohaerens TaxID=70995 RepID=UPI00036AC9F4|nr:DUF3108 domain-containing protein [Lewinella cohaerens]
MKYRIANLWIFVVFLPLLLAFSPTVNQGSSPGIEPCNTSNDVFEAGEELVYKIYYNWNFVWLSAGEVVFRVYDDGDDFHLSARGRTYSSYEWFFEVRDNYDSYISKETLLPRLSIRDIKEGNYERYDKVTFDQANQTAVSLKGRSRSEATPENFNLDGCMHDILSIMYYLRNVEVSSLRTGQEVPVKIFFDRETYPLKVKYLGAEDNTKVKGMGRYKTYKFSPQLIAGEVFKEGDEMSVFVSRDKNKIPVLIESPVSVGSVKVVLKSYKGLKYDFTAKVN